MHALTAPFIDGTTGRKTLAWLGLSILFIASFAIYFVPVITAETGGLRPLDTQVPLTAEVIYRDLLRYSPEAIRVYGWFLFVDCFYPATLATYIAYFWSLMLRYVGKPQLTNIFRKGLVLLPFAGALLDRLREHRPRRDHQPLPRRSLECRLRRAGLPHGQTDGADRRHTDHVGTDDTDRGALAQAAGVNGY